MVTHSCGKDNRGLAYESAGLMLPKISLDELGGEFSAAALALPYVGSGSSPAHSDDNC